MMLEVPFYFNSGHECGQVSLFSCLKYKFPELDVSLDDLNHLTHHQGNNLTLPVQLAAGLSKLGLPFSYYMKDIPFESIGKNLPSMVNNFYSPFGKNLLECIDISAVEQSLKDLEGSKNVFSIDKKFSMQDIENLLEQGKAVSSLVNMDLFFARENRFGGHYITLTGFDSDSLFFHNSGPCKHGKNIKIDKHFYDSIRDLCFMDWGLIAL